MDFFGDYFVKKMNILTYRYLELRQLEKSKLCLQIMAKNFQ